MFFVIASTFYGAGTIKKKVNTFYECKKTIWFIKAVTNELFKIKYIKVIKNLNFGIPHAGYLRYYNDFYSRPD